MSEMLVISLLKALLSTALQSPEVRDSEIFQMFLSLLRELDKEFDWAMFFSANAEVEVSHEKLPVLPSNFES